MYLVDLHLRRQTFRRLLLAAPVPDPALAELLLASSSSRAVFKSCTKASIFFKLRGDGGSEIGLLPKTRRRLNSCTNFCSIFSLFSLSSITLESLSKSVIEEATIDFAGRSSPRSTQFSSSCSFFGVS